MKNNHHLFLTVTHHLFETVPDFGIGQLMECLKSGTHEHTLGVDDSTLLVRLLNTVFRQMEQHMLIRHYKLTQVEHKPHAVNFDDEYHKCEKSFKENVLVLIPRGGKHQQDGLLSLVNADMMLPVCKFLYEQHILCEKVQQHKILDELTAQAQQLNLGY